MVCSQVIYVASVLLCICLYVMSFPILSIGQAPKKQEIMLCEEELDSGFSAEWYPNTMRTSICDNG